MDDYRTKLRRFVGPAFFLLIILLPLAFLCFRPRKVEQVQGPKAASGHWTMVALGDVMLAENRNAGRAMAANGVDFPFAYLKKVTKKGTLTFANLESPIATVGSPLPGKKIAFRANPRAAQALVGAGIDLVSLANNHIVDYDGDALLETISILDQHRIGSVGAGENWEEATAPLFLTAGGQRIAFFAATEMADLFFSYSYPRAFRATEDQPGVAPLEREWLLGAIAKVRSDVDLVVVSLHWGVEDSSFVTEKQRALAKALIDAGADLILGHHPHVLQGLEFYRGKLICYSLANCVFDQNDELNKQGMVLTLSYQGKRLERVWALPIYMYEKGQPNFADPEKGEEILGRLMRLSERLGTNCVQMGEAVYFSENRKTD